MIPVQIIAEIAKRATAATAAAAPAIAGSLTKGAALERREFRDLTRRAKQNRLGMSKAQQNQLVGAATQDALAQQRAATAAAARSAAVSGMQSGQATQALAKAQQSNLGATQAAARGQAAALSQQVADQERAALRELAAKRRERVEATTTAIAGALAGQEGGKDGDSKSKPSGTDFTALSNLYGKSAGGKATGKSASTVNPKV